MWHTPMKVEGIVAGGVTETADAVSGQWRTRWSGLAHIKQGCLALVASVESHLAVSSGSAANHYMDASLRQNWELY